MKSKAFQRAFRASADVLKQLESRVPGDARTERHGSDVGDFIALIAGFSHMLGLNDITPPDAKRFALDAFAMVLLAAIVLPLPEGLMGMMLNCPYL